MKKIVVSALIFCFLIATPSLVSAQCADKQQLINLIIQLLEQKAQQPTIVSSQTSVEITSPNGGFYQAGGSMTVTWNKTGPIPSSPNYYVYLKSKSDQVMGGNPRGKYYEMVFKSPSLDSSFSMTLPTDLKMRELSPLTSNAYYLELDVVDSVNKTLVATNTSKAFTITYSVPILQASSTQPLITVISPNGRESWAVGQTRQIEWISPNYSGTVNLQLCDIRGLSYPISLCSDIATVPNSGSYYWTIPAQLSGMVLGGGNVYKIEARIFPSGMSGPTAIDFSDDTFSISSYGNYYYNYGSYYYSY
jgi:hypothetical protein